MKNDKKETSSGKYKAVNLKNFKQTFNDQCPFYKELCAGEAVKLDPNCKHTKYWLEYSHITKEI